MRKRLTLKDESSKFTATMDARVLEPKPIVHIELTDLDAERDHCLPLTCKWLVWSFVAVVVITSCTVILIHGEHFSRVKTYVWIAAFLLSSVISAVLLEPARILLQAAVKCFLQKNVVIQKRILLPRLVWNPENPEKKKKILNSRQYKAKLYSPTPLYKLKNRLDDIKYHLEMKCILMDTLICTLLFLCNSFISFSPLNSKAYYNNNAAVETFLNGRYTHSFSYSGVKTYRNFMTYMNDTLLPSLLPGFVNQTEIIELPGRRRRIRSGDSTVKRQTKPPPDNAKKMQLLDYWKKKLYGFEDHTKPVLNDAGWTITQNSKLMGKARMRQVRVRSDYCKETKYLKPRNVICAPELNIFNVETRNFSLRWKHKSPIGVTEKENLPWKYQSAWKTATLPILTKTNMYPGGGYILELPRNIEDARIVLEYLDAFHWVDIRTRAIIVEFTVYCVNTHLFDVVTLIAERSATGYFSPSYTIDTFGFILELSFQLVFCLLMCCGLLLWLVVREIHRMRRTSFKIYINRPSAFTDTCVIVFGIIHMLLILVNHFYVSFEVRKLEQAQSNRFIGFVYASFWSFVCDVAGGIFMCSLFFQLLRLFSYKAIFYKIQIALAECYKRFLYLLLHKIVLLTSFSLYFHAIFVYRFETFSEVFEAQLTLFCRTIIAHDYVHHNAMTASIFLAPVMFFLFVVLVSIFSVNAFLVVMCLYYHKVRQVSLHDRYHFLRYLAYCMTYWRHKDIVTFEMRKVVDVQTDENPLATLRLRGGGHKMSRKNKAKEEYEVGGNEFMKVYLPSFATRKLYDTTQYLDLSAERLTALKFLMMYHVSEDARVKNIFSDYALRALYCVVITRDKTASQEQAQYFFVVKKSRKEVYETGVLLSMKKVVEDFAKEAGITRDEYMESDEVLVSERLEDLDRKLSFLTKKLDSKRRGVDVGKS